MVFPFFLVCKEPPYKVEESGYAGFIMPIEVYFKNKVGSSRAVSRMCILLETPRQRVPQAAHRRRQK